MYARYDADPSVCCRTDDPDAESATHAFLLEALAGQVAPDTLLHRDVLAHICQHKTVTQTRRREGSGTKAR
jgi:hypothetical protein